MSASLSPRKAKRSRSDSEANESFVKSVTSRMSGLLPATITKWFSSSSPPNTNGSTVVESTDSSTEDEANDDLRTPNQRKQPSQPPAKRMRYSTPGTSTYYVPETKSTSTNTDTTDTYSTLTTKNAFRPETNYVSTPSRSPSEASTINENEKEPSIYIYQDSMVGMNTSVVQTRKSIFGVEDRIEQSCAKSSLNTYKDLSQPYFKPGLLCTPFYTSRPIYGGPHTSYMNKPNIKDKTKALVHSSNNSNSINISHSAKRVMDLLENYSSPVIEARRISRLVDSSSEKNLDISLDSSVSSANHSKGGSYKRQELHVPSIASILQLKHKSRLMDTTRTARQIIASHSSSINSMPYPASKSSAPTEASQEKHTTKMKARVTRVNREDKTANETNSIPIVELPTAVLQIDKNNLPKFSLDTPVSHSSIEKQKVPELMSTETNAISLILEPTVSKDQKPTSKPNSYTFSSPIRISHDKIVTSTATFTFGSPERSIEKSKGKEQGNNIANTILQEEAGLQTITQQSQQKWKCGDCWVSNDQASETCVCCGGARPTQSNKQPNLNNCTCKGIGSQVLSSKCSVCLNKSECVADKPDPKVSESTKLSTWKCQDYWVNNALEKDKCECCGAKNEQSIPKPLPKINSEKQDIDWKCEDCWIKNKPSDEKCVACGGLKVGRKENHTASLPATAATDTTQKNKNTDSLLQTIVKTQTDKWECPSCFVRNDNNKSKCVCCETEKPGLTKESEKKSFNFGVSPNTFKFGIDPKQNATEKTSESKVLMVSSPETPQQETNNNIISKAPSFTFGIQNKKPASEISKEVENKVAETPKAAFTFGILKDNTSIPTATPAFKLSTEIFSPPSVNPKPTRAPTVNDSEPAQEVPSVDQSQLPVTETLPKSIGMFGSSLTKESTLNKSITNSMPAFSSSFTAGNSTIMPPVTTTTNTLVSSNTTFSITGNELSNNMFKPIPTTEANSFPTPQAPVTASVSMFQKNELSNTSMSFFQKTEPPPLALFQKNETPTTTAAVPVSVPSAPVFSFGKNTPTAAPQAEKPSFSFTFGRDSKPEVPSMFKMPFGSTPDNSTTNKFMMPPPTMTSGSMVPGSNLGGSVSGNSLPIMLGGSNPLSGLTTGNGLPQGNIMDGLSQNPLSMGNNLMSNNAANASGDMFNTPVQKENIWASSNNNTPNNMFGSSEASNNLQKRPFTFGPNTTSTPFNTSSAFDNASQSRPMFGMSNQTNPMFGNATPSPMASNMFGSQPSNPTPAVGMFGNSNVAASQPPTFGVTLPSFPTFDSPNINQSMNSAPPPTFNFGAQQQTSGIFGFGQQPQQQQHLQQQQQQPQQQQQQQTPQQGVYNFGASPQVQFTVGTAPNTSGRRMRKAFRRTQR